VTGVADRVSGALARGRLAPQVDQVAERLDGRAHANEAVLDQTGRELAVAAAGVQLVQLVLLAVTSCRHTLIDAVDVLVRVRPRHILVHVTGGQFVHDGR